MAYVKLNGKEIPALVVEHTGIYTYSMNYFYNCEKRHLGSDNTWTGIVTSNSGVAGNFLAFDCIAHPNEDFDYSLDENSTIRVHVGTTVGNSYLMLLYKNVETFRQKVYPSLDKTYFAIIPYVINPSVFNYGITFGFSFLLIVEWYQGSISTFGEFLLLCDEAINSMVGIDILRPLKGLSEESRKKITHNFIGGDQNVDCGFTYDEYPDAYNTDSDAPPSPPDDPYIPGGTTGPGGGTGTFTEENEPVDFPSLPTLSAADTGLITLYNPSLSQLQNLASYLWSDLFDINTWKKLFANPMDAILGLSIVPVAVPNEGAVPIKVGNIVSDVSANRATAQFVQVDCGTVDINEYWGAYLDYNPYTKIELYLPYIGIHPLNTDDVMGKTMHIIYHVDILSGACCAYVKCGTSVLYSFVGQCSSSIPITGSNFSSVISGAISIATSIGVMVATEGATAPMAIPSIASTATNSMKTTVEKSGSLSGTGGLMSIQRPYLILTRPWQAIPENQNRYSGYPSFITYKLADLTGYTEVESIHLENIPAAEQELAEIEELLKGGVIL